MGKRHKVSGDLESFRMTQQGVSVLSPPHTPQPAKYLHMYIFLLKRFYQPWFAGGIDRIPVKRQRSPHAQMFSLLHMMSL